MIYGLAERGEAVTNTSLATRLEVSPSSASGMVTKLSQQGLVAHVPYRGIELTGEGRLLARAVLRRHRLIESYLVSELGYTWDEVHVEADQLEHAVSDRLVERIAAKLGNPVRDPHGDPIPAMDGSVEELSTHLLDELEPGTVGEIVRVWDTDPDLLRYLSERSIGLGERIEVVERQPFGGPIVVRVGSQAQAATHALGKEIAQALSVAVR
ncbi:iron (metal) dependent repressor, DtxR family [Amycolatopsis marina]|uniref:Manganese transport regulator n=1 Tax=Amycolatopsis marina TaxID=490629 RepID=A0A1I1BJM4_9PSEU|nr:iron (metal) dependent repressor, DtxR family [Amycolatopsis marina]